MSKIAPILAYIVPEFPGQTHVWIWREINQLKAWNVQIHLFSTRPPSATDRARHAWSDNAIRQTRYLSQISPGEAIFTACWLLTRPMRTLRCVGLALRLPIDRTGRKRPMTIKLLLPAAVLARQLERVNADHLHSHSCASGAILCMMVKRLTGIPYGVSLNAPVGWWGGAMQEKLGEAKFTLVITDNLMKELASTLPSLPAERRCIGRVGVDTRVHTPAGPVVRDGSTRALLTVGRLHPSKGHDDVLRAVARLRDVGKPVKLRIAGAGPQEQELQDLTRSLGLDGYVTFLGSLSEDAVLAEMRSADAFVLASHAEPMGVVYMEAMSCGVPTIGTAAGGVGEIIRNGLDGLLVPPRDPIALATTIDRILTDSSLRERLFVEGRKRIVDVFDARHGAAVLYRRAFDREPPDWMES